MELYNDSGSWVDIEPEVERVAVDYFRDMFTSTIPSEIEELLSEVRYLLWYQNK